MVGLLAEIGRYLRTCFISFPEMVFQYLGEDSHIFHFAAGKKIQTPREPALDRLPVFSGESALVRGCQDAEFDVVLLVSRFDELADV